MTTYYNPGPFIVANPDVPFNFDMGWEDFDSMYHDATVPSMLKGGGGPDADPCTWSAEFKAEVNRQRDEWMARYKAWCERIDRASGAMDARDAQQQGLNSAE